MENEDEQLRWETEMAQMDIGLAVHGVASSVAVLTDAIARHRQFVSTTDIRHVGESLMALRALLDVLEMKDAAE